MENNRFEELWSSGNERIFPDWSSDIRELRQETRSGEKFNVEVILDRMDGKNFFSLFDYEGGHIADSLGGSGTVAVMNPENLIKRYEEQMRVSQPVFRFYRIAASVAGVIGLDHPDIASAPDSVFRNAGEDCIADPGRNRILFRKDARESAETYFSLFVMIRRLWQTRKAAEVAAEVKDLKIDALAFGVLMMDVLFQIEYPADMIAGDEITRGKVRRRTIELAEELY